MSPELLLKRPQLQLIILHDPLLLRGKFVHHLHNNVAVRGEHFLQMDVEVFQERLGVDQLDLQLWQLSNTYFTRLKLFDIPSKKLPSCTYTWLDIKYFKLNL